MTGLSLRMNFNLEGDYRKEQFLSKPAQKIEELIGWGLKDIQNPQLLTPKP